MRRHQGGDRRRAQTAKANRGNDERPASQGGPLRAWLDIAPNAGIALRFADLLPGHPGWPLNR
ncbi:hypothetical protein [Croceicoccus sp. BE223]|uniref:hypothetical protein n=1 Tax=Croceicoccus sp. BE223 TaxID=2817716 RepID=UPI0028591933|nr:hypothetical protein [Croceicoccus sp. BE223]MDR7101748.1 hypothetical protein [Croceicoccus sp. BE223]